MTSVRESTAGPPRRVDDLPWLAILLTILISVVLLRSDQVVVQALGTVLALLGLVCWVRLAARARIVGTDSKWLAATTSLAALLLGVRVVAVWL